MRIRSAVTRSVTPLKFADNLQGRGLAVEGLEIELVAFNRAPSPEDSLTNLTHFLSMAKIFRRHDGVVGPGGRVVVVTPKPSMHRLDPTDGFYLIHVPQRDEIMPPGHNPLNDNFRAVFQDLLGFPSQGVAKEDCRCHHKHNQRINGHQGNVFALSSSKAREGVVQEVALSFKTPHHGERSRAASDSWDRGGAFSSAASSRCIGGRTMEPEGKWSKAMG